MITAEGTRLGHFYDGRRANAPCEQCHVNRYVRTGENILFLTCEYDDGSDDE